MKISHKLNVSIFITPLIFLLQASYVNAQINETDIQSCLLKALDEAAPELTVAEVKASCSVGASTNTNIDTRLGEGYFSIARESGLSAHHPNYVLPVTYNENPNQLTEIIGIDDIFDQFEAEFQVSIKFPLVQNLFNDNTDLMMAYTSHSWWQVYNKDYSSLFRETNYQPEIFLRHYLDSNSPGAKLSSWDLGFVHESNGRSETFSRSWNRVYAAFNFNLTESLKLGVKSWYRLPEEFEEDDNPDIYHYRGYGQIRAVYQANKHTISAMYRPGTKEDGFELTWSYPLTENLNIYTKIYNGYGESLLDYNHKVKRIGIGFSINDFSEFIAL